MSKFNKSSQFFKKNSSQIPIITKKSQKEIKKSNKKSSEKINNISDEYFEKLMNDDDDNKNIPSVNKKKITDYLDLLNSKSNKSIKSIDLDNLGKGKEFENKIVDLNLTGIDVLNCILNKFNDPKNYSWVEPDEYGMGLGKLFENNLEDQLLFLIAIQNYSVLNKLPKVIYKNKEVYYIKLIFQLLFTFDIIEEETYWNWQDLLGEFTDVDQDVKDKINIQITEFFNILKMTFTDDDYELTNDNGSNGLNGSNGSFDKLNDTQKISNDIQTDDKIILSNSNPDLVVPEEQDYYMDDDDFNLDN